MRRIERIEKCMNYFRDAFLEQDRKIRFLEKSIVDILKTRRNEKSSIRSCCRDLNDAYNRGIVHFKTTNGKYPFLYIKSLSNDTKAIYFCPFCGEKIDFDEWHYMVRKENVRI